MRTRSVRGQKQRTQRTPPAAQEPKKEAPVAAQQRDQSGLRGLHHSLTRGSAAQARARPPVR